MIKKDASIIVLKAHEEERYKQHIGHFKKPDTGMLAVIKDLSLKEFNQAIDAQTSIMIGDTWHDKAAAQTFGIPFIEAPVIHGLGLSKPIKHWQQITG